MKTLVTALLFLSLSAIAQTNSYTVTPIVDYTQDSFLINPWGLSRPINSHLAENEWWVSDNATGYTTLYYADKTGINSLAPLVITIPTGIGTGTGSPTGTAYNPAVGPGPGKENFAFSTLDGTISNWNASQRPNPAGSGCYQCHVNTTTIMVNHSNSGASYAGMTIAVNSGTHAPTYYVANTNGGVEAYDAATFAPVKLSGSFSDPQIPAGYTPFGIQAIGSKIVVTFYNGSTGGYADVFDTQGNRLARLPHQSLDEPWGVALAPAKFGAFSNALLIGNTQSGWIGAYNSKTGKFLGFLEDSSGATITIPGLWGIEFGNGNAESGPTNTLYFAGGGNYQQGIFGAITAN